MNILVIGSIDTSNEDCRKFLGYFAKEIVDNGHVLLNGCRNEMDKIIAKNVYDALVEKGEEPRNRMISYCDPNKTPVHNYGTILISHCTNWASLASPDLLIPETIEKADVVFAIGGEDGTNCAANWARIKNKPLLPIANFKGSAAVMFKEEQERFDKNFAHRIDSSAYDMLNQFSFDMARIAKDVLALAARVMISNQVFVIMSFSGESKLEDAFDSIQTVCSEFNYECIRINETSQMDRILPEIFAAISNCAFVIADISDPRPNVYYELGYAQGLQKQVIIVAYKDTQLPFDIVDYPTIFWEGQKQLKEGIRNKIAVLSKKFGR